MSPAQKQDTLDFDDYTRRPYTRTMIEGSRIPASKYYVSGSAILAANFALVVAVLALLRRGATGWPHGFQLGLIVVLTLMMVIFLFGLDATLLDKLLISEYRALDRRRARQFAAVAVVTAFLAWMPLFLALHLGVKIQGGPAMAGLLAGFVLSILAPSIGMRACQGAEQRHKDEVIALVTTWEEKAKGVKPADVKPVDASPAGGKPVDPASVEPKSLDIKPPQPGPADARTLSLKLAEAPPPSTAMTLEIKPAAPASGEVKLAEIKPAEVKPADPKAADLKPAESKPADTKSSESKPVEPKSPESKPADCKPVESKVPDAKPGEPKTSP